MFGDEMIDEGLAGGDQAVKKGERNRMTRSKG